MACLRTIWDMTLMGEKYDFSMYVSCVCKGSPWYTKVYSWPLNLFSCAAHVMIKPAVCFGTIIQFDAREIIQIDFSVYPFLFFREKMFQAIGTVSILTIQVKYSWISNGHRVIMIKRLSKLTQMVLVLLLLWVPMWTLWWVFCTCSFLGLRLML